MTDQMKATGTDGPIVRLLYSTIEACRMLGIKSEKTLNKHIREGKLRYVLIGRRRMFDPADLKEFIEGSKVSWPSIGAQIAHSGNTASPLRVVGLEEARKRIGAKTRKSSRPN